MPFNIDPFAPAPTPAPIAVPLAAVQIIRAYKAAALAKKAAYLQLQKAIWSGGEERGSEIIAEIQKLAPGLPSDMQTSAILEKTVMNTVSPGTIADTVPEATITMPK